MAEFKEELVINTLHPEKAEVGKKYWFADNITTLKDFVENDNLNCVYEFEMTVTNRFSPKTDTAMGFCLLYPYEEPPKKRMTYRQLAEWLAKGNGQFTTGGTIYHSIGYNNCNDADEHTLKGCYKIRYWDSEEWIEPTVDIYEQDCKGGRK